VSPSHCLLYLSAAKDDKTRLNDLRGAKCAVGPSKTCLDLGNQLSSTPFLSNAWPTRYVVRDRMRRLAFD
jgi:hypothetical protein